MAKRQGRKVYNFAYVGNLTEDVIAERYKV